MKAIHPTAKRRKHRKHHTAPKTRKRRTHRRKGLSEGLSSGIVGSVTPILMGTMGGILGLIVNSMLPKQSPLVRLGIGLVGAGVIIKMAKAPNFGSGFAAGITMPVIADLLKPQEATMNDGYLSSDLPAIIDDDEELSETAFLSAGYMGADYLSDSPFDDFE